MNGKHTPGPWVSIGASVYIEEGADHYSIAICTCNDARRNQEDQEANARLIAAAPEMLEALQSISRILGKGQTLSSKHDGDYIWHLIGKATGEAQAPIKAASIQ